MPFIDQQNQGGTNMTWSIAIVDDDYQVLKGITATLSHSNLNCKVVGTAKNGEEGYDMVMTKQPDLVITDIYMPKMDGIEMIRSLRQQNFDNKIIILSGYSEFKHAQQALKLKIEDYISKPASRLTIIETVEGIFQQLEEQRKNQLDYQRYKTKVRQYEQYLTEELIELAVKGLLNLTTLQVDQKKVIAGWGSQLHLAIKLQFSLAKEKQSNQAEYPLMDFAIANIIKDTIYDFDLDYHYIEIDRINSILCLHTPHQNKAILADHLDKLIKQIKHNLDRLLSVEVSYEIGTYTTNWTETVDRIHDLLMKKNPNESDTYMIEVTSIKKELARAIRSTDIELIQHTLQHFFVNIFELAFIPSIALHVGIELWTIFKYELADNGISMTKSVNTSFNLYQQFAQFRSWQELYDYFNDIINEIANQPVFQENIRHSKLIDQVLKYIDQNIDKPITLNEIAEELYISRNYLGKLFKNKMQLSFKEYLRQTRIEKARKMLLAGNDKIYQVAEAVGFDNPAYFTAVFKKVLGYSPSQLLHEEIREHG